MQVSFYNCTKVPTISARLNILQHKAYDMLELNLNNIQTEAARKEYLGLDVRYK